MRQQRVEQDVHEDVDIFSARRATRELARSLRFDRIACIELAIVASELCSNILKYGVRGRLVLESLDDVTRGPGLRLSAFDEGPPFTSFDTALRDGFDDQGQIDPLVILHRGGIGAGLGAVRRFSDEMGWAPAPSGKRVWALRYVVRGR